MLAPICRDDDGRLPELVIFDVDGTLVESEALASEVQSQYLRSLGIPVAPSEIAQRFAGFSVDVMYECLTAEHGVEIAPAARTKIASTYASRIAVDLRPTPGASLALSALQTPFCAASNTSRSALFRMLRTTGLLRHFGPRIFSADDVGPKKPDPSLFLLAAEIMGATPSQILVVEDSVAGVRAAKAAGMRVAAYAGGSHHSDASREALASAMPDRLIDRLTELVTT